MENEFLKIARHQLKGPITIIKGCLSFWQTDDFQKFPLEKQKELINRAMAGTEKMNVLINDVFLALEFETEKGISINPEPINLKEFIENIYNENHKSAYEKKNLYFKIEGAEEPITVNSDKHHLTIVFQKILDNAEKYVNTGGTTITINLQENTKCVIIEIKDTGIGMSGEEIKVLFEKFFHGSLSLYNVKKIIDSLKGEISAESDGKDKGTKFIIKLPSYIK